MFTDIQLVLNALYAFVIFNIACIALIYGIKLRNVSRNKRYDQFNLQFKDYMTYIQANLESGERLRVPPVPLKGKEAEALQDRLYDMIECFAGDQRQKLKELCEDLGFVKLISPG